MVRTQAQARGARAARGLLAAAAVAAALGGGWGGVAAQPAPVTVTVDLDEWSVAASPPRVAAGVPLRFVVTNRGTITHSLQVAGLGAQTALLAPGERGTVEVAFAQPGQVQLVCPVGGGSHRQRGMEAALDVTAPPAGQAVQATPAPPPTPTAVVLTAPGANVDRVGLPEAYQTRLGTFYVFDRADNRQVRHVYGNAAALQAQEGQPLPYGSMLVMETYRAALTADNQIQLDASGRYVKGELAGIFVMRKERGYGEKYGSDRTGEWEFVAYRADGSGFQTPPERSQACAQCHLATSDAQRDWVVRANLFFANPQPALAGIAGLPRTGHGAVALLPTVAPVALALAGSLVVLAGAAARSLVRRR